MSELARFQDAFTAGLAGNTVGLTPWNGDGPGLAVYRNTIIKGAIDALAGNFPTVERLVGTEWFRAAAREFTEQSPPAAPALVACGAAFPDWLGAFPPASALPYLAAIARLDRAWMEAYVAEDAVPLAPEALTHLDAAALENTTARLHPSVRIAWFKETIPGLWLANREGAPEGFALEERPQGMLIARPQLEVRTRLLCQGAFAFIAASWDGASLAEAAAAALAVPDADLPAIFAACLEDGLFVALEPVGGT